MGGWVHPGFSPCGVESIRGWVHSGFSPFGVEFIRGLVHAGLCPFGVVSIRGWIHSGFCPIRGCVHSGISPILDSVVLGSVEWIFQDIFVTALVVSQTPLMLYLHRVSDKAEPVSVVSETPWMPCRLESSDIVPTSIGSVCDTADTTQVMSETPLICKVWDTADNYVSSSKKPLKPFTQHLHASLISLRVWNWIRTNLLDMKPGPMLGRWTEKKQRPTVPCYCPFKKRRV